MKGFRISKNKKDILVNVEGERPGEMKGKMSEVNQQ